MTVEQLVEIIDPEAMDGFAKTLSDAMARGSTAEIAHHLAYNKWGRQRDLAFTKAKMILALDDGIPK